MLGKKRLQAKEDLENDLSDINESYDGLILNES